MKKTYRKLLEVKMLRLQEKWNKLNKDSENLPWSNIIKNEKEKKELLEQIKLIKERLDKEKPSFFSKIFG